MKNPKIQKGRLRLLFQIILSLITCYGMLNVVAFIKNEPLYIWSLEEYNPYNLRMFYREIFWKCILFSFTSWLFFHIGLRLLIFKIFHNKLKLFFQKQFDNDKLNDIFIKIFEIGQNIRKELYLIKPQEKKEHITNKEDELEYNVAIISSDLALGVHVLICICVLNITYSPVWIISSFILLFIIIFGKPFVKNVNHENH